MPIALVSDPSNLAVTPERSHPARRAALRQSARSICCVLLVLSGLGLLSMPAQAEPGIETQDPAELITVVHDYLSAATASYPGSATISINAPRLTRQEPCSQLQAFLSSGQRLRSRLTVGVRCMAPTTWTTYVQANLSILGYYYVASRPIQPGDTISMDDLNAREGDLLRLSPGIAADPSLLIGHIATQRIPTGTPIKTTALRDPNSIQRGQMIRTEVRGPGFVANGEGQALQGGSPGTQIQIKSSSGQVITGTVLDANTALVM